MLVEERLPKSLADKPTLLTELSIPFPVRLVVVTSSRAEFPFKYNPRYCPSPSIASFANLQDCDYCLHQWLPYVHLKHQDLKLALPSLSRFERLAKSRLKDLFSRTVNLGTSWRKRSPITTHDANETMRIPKRMMTIPHLFQVHSKPYVTSQPQSLQANSSRRKNSILSPCQRLLCQRLLHHARSLTQLPSHCLTLLKPHARSLPRLLHNLLPPSRPHRFLAYSLHRRR